MGYFLYCMSNPSIPGVVRIDYANWDPREQLEKMGPSARSQRIDWVVRVADGPASLAAMQDALAAHVDTSWPGHFRCDPMRARAVAIDYTTVRSSDEYEGETRRVNTLPCAVLALGLAVQFLGIINGHTGPSVALIAAALFWVVHTLPIGSGDQHKTA